jgi:hypothetical protein
MTKRGDGSSISHFITGDVSGTGIVIGNESSVVIGQSPEPMQPELIRSLDKLIELLEQYESSIEDEPGLRESIMEARREIGKPMPRWAFVRTLLRGIAASVAGVSALTDAVGNILTIVSKASH